MLRLRHHPAILLARALLLAVAVVATPALADTRTVVLRDGSELTGEVVALAADGHVTLRLPDGRVREIPWSRVASLVRRGATYPSVTDDEQTATLVITSSSPRVNIDQASEPSAAVDVGARGTSRPPGGRWTPLCQTPCRLRLRPGVVELRVGDKAHTEHTEVVNLRPGENAFVATTGSPATFNLGVLALSLGLASTFIGAVAWWDQGGGSDRGDPSSHAKPMVFLGAPLAVVGLVLWRSGRTTLEPSAGRDTAALRYTTEF